MVTAVETPTGLVLTVKVALVAPPATVTLAGTRAAAVLLLASVTCAPPAGAGPLRVTVPVDGLAPVTLVGLSASEVGTGGKTVSDPVRVPLPYDAEIVAAVETPTALVVTVKVALVPPPTTVTLAGTIAAGLVLLSDT